MWSTEFTQEQKIAIVAGMSVFYARSKRKRMRREYWQRPWIGRRIDNQRGTLSMVFNELQHEDPVSFFNFLRMDVANFEQLLDKVRPYIERQDTVMRQCISARERLGVTLRFLATGDAYKSLNFYTRISIASISTIVPETCNAIYQSLKDDFLKAPSTEGEWKAVEEQFKTRWNFPNVVGAMDGKHIEFRPPRSQGSFFRNYKGTDSIVFLALADANYRFLIVDVGVNGRVSDGGVFRESDLHSALENETLGIPGRKLLPGGNIYVPHMIVADDAFPLRTYLMKPFPQRNLTHDERVYNYRLSRARMVVENAFGIFSNRFRVFLSKIKLSEEKVKMLTLAACALHNYLIQKGDPHYLSPASVDHETAEGTIEPGSWRFGPHFNQNMTVQARNRPTNEALLIRNELKRFFNNEGKVSWQERRI